MALKGWTLSSRKEDLVPSLFQHIVDLRQLRQAPILIDGVGKDRNVQDPVNKYYNKEIYFDFAVYIL